MDLELSGRPVLVTGASQGIGLEIARTLLREGSPVAICARGEARLTAVARELRGSGIPVFARALDVTDHAALSSFVDAAAAELGGLFGIVANADGTTGGSFEESRPEDWVDTFERNVGHAANLVRSAIPHLARAGGSAVFISSISGTKPAPRSQYGVSKAGLIYLAAVLSRELAPKRIRVNAVSPGSILVPDGAWDAYRIRDPEGFQQFLDRDLPWGRLGTAREVADVVAFALSPRASWISGANLAVDGAQGRANSSAW